MVTFDGGVKSVLKFSVWPNSTNFTSELREPPPLLVLMEDNVMVAGTAPFTSDFQTQLTVDPLSEFIRYCLQGKEAIMLFPIYCHLLGFMASIAWSSALTAAIPVFILGIEGSFDQPLSGPLDL